MRFKGLLNISVAAAGLRLLLCRFCAFPLPVWAIPVGGSALAGAIKQLRCWGCSLCCWGGPTTRDGEGVYQGVAEKQGVSLAHGIGLYTHIPSPLSQTYLHWHVSWGSYAGAPSGGVAEKGAGGFSVINAKITETS